MLRAIGFVFCTASVVVIAIELIRLFSDGIYKFTTLGATWASIDFGSLNLAQALVQRYVHPWLWDPAIQTVLTVPMWLVFAILGVIFLGISALRRKGGE